MNIKVSIIMPVYNVENYLYRSINSVLNQSLTEWELIAVNDGSSDSSGEILDEISAKESRIHVIHQKNSGSGRARQNALNVARGEYICFVDPDDYIEEDALKNNYHIATQQQVDLVINGFIEEIKQGDNEFETKVIPTNLEGKYHQDEFRKAFFKSEKNKSRALWNKLYSHKFLKDNDCTFSDQRIGQDALFNYQVYKNIESVYVSNNSYYHYYLSREGSAIKGYKKERAEYELNIASSFEKLIAEWNLLEYYNEEIKVEYWDVVYTELKNLNFSDCPLNEIEKISKMKIVLSNHKINETISKLDYKKINPFRRILLFFIKIDQIKLALKTMKIRMNFGVE